MCYIKTWPHKKIMTCGSYVSTPAWEGLYYEALKQLLQYWLSKLLKHWNEHNWLCLVPGMIHLPVSSQISAPAIGWQRDLYVILTPAADRLKEWVVTKLRQRYWWPWPWVEGIPEHFFFLSQHWNQVNRKSWNICITGHIGFQIKWMSWQKVSVSSTWWTL